MGAASRDGGLLERARRALIALAALALACDGDGAGSRAFPVPGERGDRVTVEVLNASGQAGVARNGVRVLRRAGIDVVGFGNAPAAIGRLDSTRIVVRRGDAAVGERVREALGIGRVVYDPDTTLLLDVSVFLGADFRPRPEFHP